MSKKSVQKILNRATEIFSTFGGIVEENERTAGENARRYLDTDDTQYLIKFRQDEARSAAYARAQEYVNNIMAICEEELYGREKR